jgi:hypothetical protein
VENFQLHSIVVLLPNFFRHRRVKLLARPPMAGKNKRANSLGPDISTEGCRGFFCRAVENSELPQHFRAVFANQRISPSCRKLGPALFVSYCLNRFD